MKILRPNPNIFINVLFFSHELLLVHEKVVLTYWALNFSYISLNQMWRTLLCWHCKITFVVFRVFLFRLWLVWYLVITFKKSGEKKGTEISSLLTILKKIMFLKLSERFSPLKDKFLFRWISGCSKKLPPLINNLFL